jgi:phage tail-like protein
MSSARTRLYRFASEEQWALTVLSKWDVQPDGSLSQSPRLNPVAKPVSTGGSGSREKAQTPLITRLGDPVELSDSRDELGNCPRLPIGRNWIWWFDPGGPVLHRWDDESLEEEDLRDVGATILDIAGDDGDGVWVLVGEGDRRELLRYDCRGCRIAALPVPCEGCHATQLASVDSARVLVLLTRDGSKLVSLDSESGKVLSVKELGDLAFGWRATQMASDGTTWIALWGPQAGYSGDTWLLFVLDGSLEVAEGPFQDIFPNKPVSFYELARVAVQGENVWFSTVEGYWKISSGDGAGARELESLILTRALRSTASPMGRGWLRVDLPVDLPTGATLSIRFASTSDPNLKKTADAIVGDTSRPVAKREKDLWDLFVREAIAIEDYSFSGPASSVIPKSTPLLIPQDEWLWLRISVISLPGGDVAKLKGLDVHYPYVTLSQSLPSIFQGETNDPGARLARLLGSVEATTERFDSKIRSLRSLLAPESAPPDWLDYLAAWFQLPWDEDLPESTKRSLLQHAGELIAWRGTRKGLLQFLRCLLGNGAEIAIADLTVDHPPLRLSCGGSALPALLAGSPRTTPRLGSKAVLGKAKLCPDEGPLANIAPCVVLKLAADTAVRKKIAAILESLIVQYIPAGVNVRIRWRGAGEQMAQVLDTPDWILDEDSPLVLGQGRKLGQALVGGRRRNRMSNGGFVFGELQ